MEELIKFIFICGLLGVFCWVVFVCLMDIFGPYEDD